MFRQHSVNIIFFQLKHKQHMLFLLVYLLIHFASEWVWNVFVNVFVYKKVNANETEYMSFKRARVISTLSSRPLILVHKFTHLRSNISSTESDISIRLAKELTVIGKLSIVWMSDLSDKIKRDFFKL